MKTVGKIQHGGVRKIKSVGVEKSSVTRFFSFLLFSLPPPRDTKSLLQGKIHGGKRVVTFSHLRKEGREKFSSTSTSLSSFIALGEHALFIRRIRINSARRVRTSSLSPHPLVLLKLYRYFSIPLFYISLLLLLSWCRAGHFFSQPPAPFPDVET